MFYHIHANHFLNDLSQIMEQKHWRICLEQVKKVLISIYIDTSRTYHSTSPDHCLESTTEQKFIRTRIITNVTFDLMSKHSVTLTFNQINTKNTPLPPL